MTALICSILIFTRAAEKLGVLEWGYDTRIRLALAGSALLLIALAALLAAGLRGSSDLGKAYATTGLILVVGTLIMIGNWGQTERLGLGPVRVGEFALVLTLAIEFVVVIAFCSVQATRHGDTAARLAAIIAIIFGGAVIVVSVVRPSGWYAEVSPDSFRSIGIRLTLTLAILLLIALLVTLVVRVRERLTVDELSLRLRWASVAAEAAAAERARLRQALRQWHGTAAAISRTVWSPFGAFAENGQKPLGEIELGAEIRKLRLYVHEPRNEDLLGVMSRIRQEVADPGWLLRQYRVAVEAFQPDYAFKTGRAVESGQIRRPEADPVPEDPWLAADVPGNGVRWMFDEMLYDGSFDRDLRAVGSEVALDAVLESYFSRTTPAPGEDADLHGFSEPLVAGEKSSLPVYLFSKIGLPIAGDAKAQYRTTVWWPSSIRRPRKLDHTTVIATTVSTAGLAGLVVPFVRSDWSEPMALGQLPFSGARGGPDRVARPRCPNVLPTQTTLHVEIRAPDHDRPSATSQPVRDRSFNVGRPGRDASALVRIRDRHCWFADGEDRDASHAGSGRITVAAAATATFTPPEAQGFENDDDVSGRCARVGGPGAHLDPVNTFGSSSTRSVCVR